MELLQQIFELCIVPLLMVLTGYLVNLIDVKAKEIKQTKYTKLIQETITNCVITTNQTYVDSLKKQGKFDLEAQKEAFKQTKDAVLAILTKDSKKYISAAYEDFDAYIDSQIESTVNLNK